MAENMDFTTRYSSFCLESKVYPLKSVIRHINGSELSIPVESVRPDHWISLLSALFHDNSLTKVHFASCVSPHNAENDSTKPKRKREKPFPVPYGRSEPNIRNMTIAIAGLLHTSEFLVILKLENLSLKIIDAQHLATGLSKAILKVLSLSGSRLEEGSIDALCNGLQLSGIAWIDFSNCDLSVADIESICKVIKTHKLKRSNERFEKTLRYRHAVLDEMEGLNRLSLSYNFIQNSGVDILVESLEDDLWIKALDLQHCGIEDEGAELLLKATITNTELEVIDLRLNLIDYGLVQRIEQQLTLNKSGKTVKYFPMPLWEPSELVRRYAALRKVKIVKKKLPTKVKLIRKVKSLKILNHSVRPTVPRVKRVAVQDVCVQTEDMVFCSGVPKNMQDIFNNLKTRFAFETKLRKFFMQKYYLFKDENEQLRELLMKTQNDDIYIDQETYFEIKQTFEKLKIFFDVMKKYGLWEYIAVLGFDDASEVVITELDDQKCVKVKRKEPDPVEKAPASNQEADEDDSDLVINAELVLGENSCCNCKKADPNHQVAGPAKQADVVHNCLNAVTSKLSGEPDKVTKDDDMLNEKLAINKLFQEVMENFSGEIHASSKPDNSKPSNCKQLDGKAVSCAQMFMKKFSYSNMPKKVKELVTPTEFYKLLKRELERYDGDIMKPLCGQHESSSQTVESGSNMMPSQPPPKKMSVKKAFQSISSSSLSNDPIFKPSTSEYVPQSKSLKDSKKTLKEQLAMSDDYDDISISELIARKKAQAQASPKYVPTKKETAKSSSSSLSSAKIKNSKMKSQNKGSEKEFRFPPGAEPMASLQKKLQKSSRTSSSTQTVKIPQTSKNIQATTHASSDEINSSDSVVTASDKMSDSSVSSSSSERSLVKNSSDQNGSEQQKSYIESVSSASTFKDVESISDIEVVSHASSLNEIEKDKNEPKIQQNASPVKAESISSSSSAKKSSKSKKVGKKAQTVASTSSSTLKSAPESQKSDKPVNTSVSIQGKGKKQSGKNRPKGSSKSSSVPSFSDITTVSSQSLNTDSIMKQISGSENDAKSGK